nr:hypothetical protein CFP56_67721 [Quercus suber]
MVSSAILVPEFLDRGSQRGSYTATPISGDWILCLSVGHVRVSIVTQSRVRVFIASLQDPSGQHATIYCNLDRRKSHNSLTSTCNCEPNVSMSMKSQTFVLRGEVRRPKTTENGKSRELIRMEKRRRYSMVGRCVIRLGGSSKLQRRSVGLGDISSLASAFTLLGVNSLIADLIPLPLNAAVTCPKEERMTISRYDLPPLVCRERASASLSKQLAFLQTYRVVP